MGTSTTTVPEDGSGREPMADINELRADEFIQRFGALCGCDWITRRIAAQRPFRSLNEMVGAINLAFHNAPEEDQAALIKHFAGGQDKKAHHGLFSRRRKAYQSHFGFPFIMASEARSDQSVVEAAFTLRLQSPHKEERETALTEVVKVIKHKLDRVIGDGPGGVNAE